MGYEVSNNQHYSLTQFANDTIKMGKGTLENLWSLKTIFRSFELVFGLQVNFHKSNLFYINLKDDFLEPTSSFLSCGISSLPFEFSGIPVGENLRRCNIWKLVVDSLQARLSSWRGCHFSTIFFTSL